MSINLKSNFIRGIAQQLGNILIFLQPNKAKRLSENRLTLVHMDKNNLSLQERLMRYALVKKLDKIDDHNKIAETNRDFWSNQKATDFFVETDIRFKTDFLPNCSFIFDVLKEELSNHLEEYTTLVEIGTGTGNVLNYLSTKFPEINRFIGIDLSPEQVEINNKKYIEDKKIEFVASDGFDWVKEHGKGNTIFVTSRGVLEYFLEERLQEFLIKVNGLGKIIFISIEPNGADHNFETHPNTQIYGNEPSFSHNYPKLFKNAGFELWHFSQKPWSGGGGGIQTFIGAKN